MSFSYNYLHNNNDIDQYNSYNNNDNNNIINSNQNLTFSIEDTYNGCYRDITSAILSRGWRKVPYQSSKKRSKLEKKRLPLKDLPLFIWTINEKDIDYRELQEYQISNHFEGITKLTTKTGFCELLHDMTYIAEDSHEISPRCYNIGDPIHRDEFIEDFSISAASNILKYILFHSNNLNNNNNNQSIFNCNRIKEKTILNCMKACASYLYQYNGDFINIERINDCNKQVYGIDIVDWNDILNDSYLVANEIFDWNAEEICNITKKQIINKNEFYKNIKHCNIIRDRIKKKKNNDKEANNSESWKFHLQYTKKIKIQLILNSLSKVNKQHYIDGTKNIWIVKAPDTSCGVGMKILYKLEDILDCEKGMGGRTVQKYIENTLLAPPNCNLIHNTATIPNQISSKNSQNSLLKYKFDIRIWVLVTSFEPLEAYIYSNVYGRKCIAPYSINLSNLGNNHIHLTNYSLQKKNCNNNTTDNTTTITNNDNNNNQTFNSNNLQQLNCQDLGNNNLGDNINLTWEQKLLEYYENADNNNNNLKRNTMNAKASNGIKGIRKLRTSSNKNPNTLLSHNDILSIINPKNWHLKVWPEIKRKIIATLQITCNHIQHRKNSFEFLGYDVIFDNNFNPWILEANMSPAIAHRNDDHNTMVAHMAEELVKVAILPKIISTSNTNQEIEEKSNLEVGFNVTTLINNLENNKNNYNNITKSSIDISNLSQINEQNILKDNQLSPCWEKLVSKPSQVPTSIPISKQNTNKTDQIRNVYNSPSINLSEFNQQSFTTRSKIRPKSAGNVRPNSMNFESKLLPSNGPKIGYACGDRPTTASMQSNNLDINFSIIGKSLNANSISFQDLMCSNFNYLLIIQKWSRKYLLRLRRYHLIRFKCSIIMQYSALRFISKCKLQHLKRNYSTIKIQNQVRILISKNYIYSLRRYNASTTIQCFIRCFISANKLISLRNLKFTICLQKWIRIQFDIRKRKASFKIVLKCKSWLKRRKRYKHIIFHLISLNYRKKMRITINIQKCVRKWLLKLRNFHFLRINYLRFIAYEVMEKVFQFREKDEIYKMNNENESSILLNILITKEISDKKEKEAIILKLKLDKEKLELEEEEKELEIFREKRRLKNKEMNSDIPIYSEKIVSDSNTIIKKNSNQFLSYLDSNNNDNFDIDDFIKKHGIHHFVKHEEIYNTGRNNTRQIPQNIKNLTLPPTPSIQSTQSTSNDFYNYNDDYSYKKNITTNINNENEQLNTNNKRITAHSNHERESLIQMEAALRFYHPDNNNPFTNENNTNRMNENNAVEEDKNYNYRYGNSPFQNLTNSSTKQSVRPKSASHSRRKMDVNETRAEQLNYVPNHVDDDRVLYNSNNKVSQKIINLNRFEEEYKNINSYISEHLPKTVSKNQDIIINNNHDQAQKLINGNYINQNTTNFKRIRPKSASSSRRKQQVNDNLLSSSKGNVNNNKKQSEIKDDNEYHGLKSFNNEYFPADLINDHQYNMKMFEKEYINAFEKAAKLQFEIQQHKQINISRPLSKQMNNDKTFSNINKKNSIRPKSASHTRKKQIYKKNNDENYKPFIF
jgi:hypothetical protein